MRTTLLHYDRAITTIKAKATKSKNYVPEVYINHYILSEDMWGLSKHTLNKKDNKTNDNNVTIGYFSISIANNAYIEMIKPALFEMLKEYGKIKILLLGELILRGNFTNYINKIIKMKFTDC